MTGDAFRFGLVGAGRMGRTHLRALEGSQEVVVAAVAEPADASRAALAASGVGAGAIVHRSIGEMLDAGGLDGVLIAAPSDRHAAIVEEAAARGLAILCEKPCGVSVADVLRAAAAAARHEVAFQVAYWRRYVPSLVSLRERILGGDLGAVHLVCCWQWDGSPPHSAFRALSGGIFVDMGVHEFDQLRWLTGQEIHDLAVVASPLVGDPDATSDLDSAQALAGMSAGTTGLVSLGRHFPDGDMVRVEVFGDRGHEIVDVIHPLDGHAAQLEALRHQAEAFAVHARGGETTGASARDAAAALEAAGRASAAVDRTKGSSATEGI